MLARVMFIFFILFLQGCAGSPLERSGNYTSIERISYPEINIVTTAEIGERLVASGKRESGPAAQVKAPTTFNKTEGEASIMTCGITLQPDIKFKKGEQSSTGEIKECFGPFLALSTTADGTTNFNCPGATLAGYICAGKLETTFDVNSSAKFKLLQDHENIEIAKRAIERTDNFIQEIIYNGRVEKTLKFIYREFSNELARPAFSQEVQYDLTESNIIGFKGLRMKIIDANNTEITYVLLKNF